VENGNRWYVARIKSHISWDIVIQQLEGQGFGAYMPLDKTKSFFPGKTVIVERPLFLGYMFVMLNVGESGWKAVNGTVGIMHLLPIGADVPLAVPTEFVDELKNRKPHVEPMEITRRFLKNEIVRFIAGPMAQVAALQARVVQPGKTTSRVALPSPVRGEIITTVRNADIALVQK
jgi:transcription antitermination factor NusG